MKKLLFFIFTALLCYSVCVGNENYSQAEETRQEIQIRQSSTSGTVVRPRSITIPAVEAAIDYDLDLIEVVINKTIGLAAIEVTDMWGYCVFREAIDTRAIGYIAIPMPDAGAYNISITGDDYRGDGSFIIE